MHHFCTLFDRNYLLKGVAMLRSLRMHCPDAHVHVLCMDELTREILQNLNLNHITCISLPDLEDEALLAAKSERSIGEYCWTLSPCLPWYVLQTNPDIHDITYLDADLFFFSSLEPVFKEIGDASIVITEHKLPPAFKHLIVNGKYCVEWVGFRRDDNGVACLKKWRDQCIEWCFYRLEEGRMGDQKYLDPWPETYNNVHVLKHPGTGVAPWNYSNYQFAKSEDGRITVDGELLVYYHFHQFQLLKNKTVDRLSDYYRALGPEPDAVYQVYETTLKQILNEVQVLYPDFSGGLKPVLKIKTQRLVQKLLPDSWKLFLRKFIKAV